MPTVVDPLTPRVRDLSQQITTKRAEAGELYAAFERARDVLAGDPKAAANPRSAAHREAQAAQQRYEQAAGELRLAEEARDGLMAMMDGSGAGGLNGPQDGDRPGGNDLAKIPGAWLSNALGRRARDISSLPENLRISAAAVSVVTTTEGGTTEESRALIDLISPQSVAIASGIPVTRIGTTETKIPRFTDPPIAGWVAELGPFPKSGPGIERVTVEPPKVGLVTPLSIEVFEDLSPLMMSMLQVQLMRAVALAFDSGILFGDGTDDVPLGIANTGGIQTVTAPLTGLGPFAQGIGALIGDSAFPGALVINPNDLASMFELTEFTGDTESLRPLWNTAIKRTPSGAFALTLPGFGVPVWPTPACPEGEALMYDPATVLAVLRREADVAVDPYYDMDNGKVGLRVYLRGDVVVGQTEGVVAIRFGTEATGLASSDVVTAAGHGFSDGTAIRFRDLTGGAPLNDETTYYVRDSDANTFKVAATIGGSAINITADLAAGVVRRA